LIVIDQLAYYRPGPKANSPTRLNVDVCIYGGTSAGVIAALQAKRMGLRVALVAFGRHLGGLTASGLGATDIGNKSAIGGMSREFYRAVGEHYGGDEPDGSKWTFEPHVAENIFNHWIEKADIPVFYEHCLDSVVKKEQQITEIIMENGASFRAKMFIDATYEGDLLARAGVSYHVGRESNDTYKETLNGIHFGSPYHNFKAWVSPYVIEGDPDSGLVFGVTNDAPGYQGQGDSSIQAYNFRICLTHVPANRMPFPKPPNYNPDMFVLLSRYMKAGVWDALKLHLPMPGGKTDLNNFGGFSTDFIGHNHGWPEGDYTTREAIFQEHVRYNLGMLYFLSNDDSVPVSIREEVRQWGLPKDEFKETGGWPHELYIREARRMVADVVMTEHHCRGYQVAEDSIGLAAYTMDSHNSRRMAIDGRCVNEGNVEIAPAEPYPISYRAIVPKREHCTNLLVPICLSSSHIAFGSIRMEPVFMILGQSAAAAAAIALRESIAVQDVKYEELRSELIAGGQILE